MGAHLLYSGLSQQELLDPVSQHTNESRPGGQLRLTASAFN